MSDFFPIKHPFSQVKSTICFIFQHQSASISCITSKSDISVQLGICSGTTYSKLLPVGENLKAYVNIIKHKANTNTFLGFNFARGRVMMIKETSWRRSFKPWGNLEKAVKRSITKVQKEITEADKLEMDFYAFSQLGGGLCMQSCSSIYGKFCAFSVVTVS